MKKQRWQQIENIIDQVLEINNPKQQEKYIKKICDNDQQLCNEVLHLLKNIQKAEEQAFLETS